MDWNLRCMRVRGRVFGSEEGSGGWLKVVNIWKGWGGGDWGG